MYRNAQDSAGFKRNRVVNLSLVILCQSFQALSFGGVALFLPLIRRDLGLSFTQGGTLSAVAVLIYALMQVPVGYLTDRFGPKRLFFFGVLGTTVLALALGLVTEYWQALAVQALSGCTRAFLFAPGLALLSGWFPPHRQATAAGFYLVGMFLGTITLDLVGPLLVVEYSWRVPFIGFASLGIVISFIFARFGNESSSRGAQQKVTIGEMLRLFRYRVMWVSGILQYIRLAIWQGIEFWLPSLLVEEKGLALQLTGLLIAIRTGIIAPSNILGGYLSDRLKNPVLVIGFSLIMLAVTVGLFIVVKSMVLLIIVIFINALFVQMYFGPLFAFPVEVLGTRTAGISRGFSNLFANLGAFSFIYLLGGLRDLTGSFNSGFYAIIGICLVGLVMTSVLARIRHSPLDRQPPAVRADAGS